MDSFITIKENISVQIVEKKSKFIADLFYVESVEQAENVIKEVKKSYYDARHNCIAFRVIENDSVIERFSDDGEPSGTAGAPMLNILQKNNLCNILIVVTRYFGGILLGTGGLVRAYSESLVKAIEESELISKKIGIEAEAIVEYNNIESFKYYCKMNNINVVNLEYLENIVCKLEMELGEKEKILNEIKEKKNLVVDLKFFRKKYIDGPKVN